MEQKVASLTRALEEANPVDGKDREGRSALFYASVDGQLEIVNLLLLHGAQVNIRDSAGRTPFHVAAQYFQKVVAQRMIDGGAELEARDKYGNTPLSDAVFYSKGQGGMILLLLSLGADRASRNDSGVSPQSLVQTIANFDVKQFFER